MRNPFALIIFLLFLLWSCDLSVSSSFIEQLLKQEASEQRRDQLRNENPKRLMRKSLRQTSSFYDEEEIDTETNEDLRVIHPPLQIHDVALDKNDTHHLYWQVDYQTESVRMEIHCRTISTQPWIAIGFTDRGEVSGADLCVFWVDWKSQTHFQNARVDSDGRMKNFARQECHNFRYRLNKGILKFTFSRRFDSCTPNHYKIERGTTHMFWSWGKGPLFKLEGVLATGDEHDIIKIELLKPNLPTPRMDNIQILDVTSKELHVPVKETTYWCTVSKLPEDFKRKHHMLKFGPKIQNGNEDIVHHMEVFHCEYPPDFVVPMYQGLCHADDRPKEIDACKRVLAAWAMGAASFAYPDEAGLQIGGKDFNPYVMLEVHYNNPLLTTGRVDSSGISITYSSRLRKYDSAIMELGLEYTPKMAIPPAMESFTLSGYCIPECTALGLPPHGINIFGSQLHTHLTGVRVLTKHYRGDVEIEEMNRDDHYSSHFQEIRRLPKPVHVLPGDTLITSCEFQTTERRNITLGGFSIRDEMCVNYVHYYPKVELEVCKSSVDSKTLVDYFDFLNRLDFQPTKQNSSWGENYHSINWTPLRSLLLQNMYNEAPISMQCNRSTGERFPGYWENKQIPRVLHPLMPKPSCNGDPQRITDNGEIITL